LIAFGLTAEQAELHATMRKFAAAELAPGYLERAKAEHFPWHLQRKLGQMGVLAMLAGPEWGGVGEPDYVALGLVVEALAYGDFNVANCMLPTLLATAVLRAHASAAAQERWMPGLTSGDEFMSIALTEPESGSDAGAMQATATPVGDGFVLNGEKTSVTGLLHARSALVFASGNRAAGARAVTAFAVDLEEAGCSRTPIGDTGWRPIGRGSLHLDDVRVSADAVVGGVGGGFSVVMNGFDFTRPLLALTAIGCAQATLDETVAYVRQRRAFGSPLASFEGVSFPLAEHHARLEAARLLCYKTLWARMRGERHTELAAMSKWYGPAVATRAVHDCLLLHGHYGYATDSSFEQRLRDVLAVEIADGTAQIQKIVIAREAFGRDFVPYRRSDQLGDPA
jgi:cyclohexanecarboxyl-CoA dehydrogenase